MERKFDEIMSEMLTAKNSVVSLSPLQVLTTSEQSMVDLNSTSKVSIWRLLFWVFSYCLFTHEKIVSSNAKNSRPQNLPNFKNSVLNFYDGLELVWKDGQFQYDLTNVADAEERKIIDRCAVLESLDGELVVKIATDNNGNLEPVTLDQEGRILAYLKLIKVPGVRIRLINIQADLLKANLTVYVDPLVIDLTTGQLLATPSGAGGLFPVKEGIKNYLANLEFNGAFVKDFFRTQIKEGDGIELVVINSIQSKYAAYDYADFAEFKIPESGYFKLTDLNLTINYLPYALVNN